MHAHERLIRDFYACFAARDAEGMGRCYHPNIFFTDPVFPSLHGEEARDMWRMLLARARDLEVTLEDASADDDGGTAHWTARYTFVPSGRKVTNHIHALFAFRDGLIVRHYDRFSLWRWLAQAYGLPGRLFGWLLPFKWKVRKEAARALEKWKPGSDHH